MYTQPGFSHIKAPRCFRPGRSYAPMALDAGNTHPGHALPLPCPTYDPLIGTLSAEEFTAFATVALEMCCGTRHPSARMLLPEARFQAAHFYRLLGRPYSFKLSNGRQMADAVFGEFTLENGISFIFTLSVKVHANLLKVADISLVRLGTYRIMRLERSKNEEEISSKEDLFKE